MSLLPQRKKSSEEVAKLRESLGIPGESPGEETLPAEILSLPINPQSAAATIPEPFPHLPVKPPKPVTSLRKSEQFPPPVARPIVPAPDSQLPSYRRSNEEIQELRRQDAIQMTAPPLHPQTRIAHPVWIGLGYLAVIGAAVGIYFYGIDIRIAAVCVIAAIIIAAFIFFKKTYSRHHAAFIAMMALLVIVFGALYYFPQLRHGT